ncbi:hypothetical protein [Streptomyces shenzhenensis]|uniref:hypothetical protein n=1 Tax=Streptomyces shenzhenensis TaxID=943815 RepID=UPI003F542084
MSSTVISNAASGLDNVKALVFVAAFLPDEGESAVTLSGKFPASKFHQQFAADVPEETAAIMAATQRPVADAVLAEAPPSRRGLRLLPPAAIVT